ncbi:MAG: (Fe-S)-binding protein, partial [Bacteroidetes bacterium]|nr:(Fe-S)-binding protein [Bacteroidota bacterium]
GGNYEVIHHTQLIQDLITQGKLKAEGGDFKGKKITFHDPCYLGRGNGVYEAPRAALEILDADLVEMKRCKSNGLCCGAGGAQMFKEPEKGKKDINIERMEDVLASKAEIVAVGCPFCMTMMNDGVKNFNKENEIEVLDIAEISARVNGL